MSKPTIADKKPVNIKLEPGDHYWCSCGKSGNQPFCDGSHAGTDFTPMKFTIEEEQDAYLCLCKHTKNPPFCDGTHAQLGEDVEVAKTDNKEALPAGRNTPEEPTVELIHELARDGLEKLGHHGPMAAMGVPRTTLPQWDDIQLLTAQLATKPLLEDVNVGSELVIGPKAEKPLHLEIPLFVSDMSFGALSEEAKTAMARGAELAGTGICSGEGGMLPGGTGRELPVTFMNLHPPNLGMPKNCSPESRLFTSREGRVQRQEPAVTFQETK